MKLATIEKCLAFLLALVIVFGAVPASRAAEARRIDISVTEMGFSPDKVAVKKGEPITLVFTRKTDKTCAKDVVIYVSDKEKIQKTLPLNAPVTVETKFAKAGDIRFACGMNMVTGTIQVQ